MVTGNGQVNLSDSSSETQDVKTFFDGYASDFDSIYGHTAGRSLFNQFADKLFRQSMYLRYRETLNNTASSRIQTVLDIGCGPGHYCEALLQQGKTVVGLDIAEGMLKIAQTKTAQYIKSGHAKYLLADYLTYQFESKFDAACLLGFFDYISEPLKVLRKLEQDISKEVYMSFPTAGGFLAVQRKIRYSLRNCPLYLYTHADLIQLLTMIGWRDRATILNFGRDYFVKVSLQ